MKFFKDFSLPLFSKSGILYSRLHNLTSANIKKFSGNTIFRGVFMKILLITFCLIFCLIGCNEEKNGIQRGTTLSTNNDSHYSPPSTKSTNTENKSKPESTGPQLLDSYSTKILTNDSNRYNNIAIVAKRLNEYKLPAGKEFSFNDVCGPYGQSDGFLEAKILLSDGSEATGFGGGVCQLSSTLYNAVKDLEVTITEHHHHSTPVAYVPINQDATVSLQSNLDFKFRNDYSKTLIFKTNHDPNNLSVSVYLEN